MSLAGVILAGGASRRMGRPKALLPFRSETVIDRLIGLFAPHCSPLIVVLGHAHEAIRAGMARTASVTFAINPDPERGQLSSLQCGLALAPGDALFTPVDFPAIAADTVAILTARFAACEAPLLAPSHGGRHGHPVLIRDAVRRQLLALPASASAREVTSGLRDRAEYIEVDDAGVCQDIDVMEDYERLLAGDARTGRA